LIAFENLPKIFFSLTKRAVIVKLDAAQKKFDVRAKFWDYNLNARGRRFFCRKFLEDDSQ